MENDNDSVWCLCSVLGSSPDKIRRALSAVKGREGWRDGGRDNEEEYRAAQRMKGMRYGEDCRPNYRICPSSTVEK